jgi:hypothetical protein
MVAPRVVSARSSVDKLTLDMSSGVTIAGKLVRGLVEGINTHAKFTMWMLPCA